MEGSNRRVKTCCSLPPIPVACQLHADLHHVCLHTQVLREGWAKCHSSLSSRPPQSGPEEVLINPALAVTWRRWSIWLWPCISNTRQLSSRKDLCSGLQRLASRLSRNGSRHMLSALRTSHLFVSGLPRLSGACWAFFLVYF